jgi:hypothetical protein
MHPLPLVILLTLAADPDRTVPVGCREDYATCREDCTIDYGGSTAKYRLLTQCMERCSNEQSECTTRHYSLRDADLDSMPQRTRDPATREPASHDDDLRDSDTRPASSTAKPQDGVRRGVYRASEGEEPAAQTEPAAMKEPAKMKDPEPEPDPAPAPKPSPAAHSKRAPTPSKDEDIRIFDDPEPEPAPAPKAAAPKPSEPLRPKPPAEPKKKDISDWDPNSK